MRSLPRLPSLLFAALVLTLAPAASAQAHQHGATSAVVIAHDAAPGGMEFVGNIAHFAVLDLGDDAVPDFHQQNHIRVSENGAVLFETTADSGHDYDGVNAFDVVFPVPGDYVVEVVGDHGATTHFNGTVQDSNGTAPATVKLDGPDKATVGLPVDFKIENTDPAGLRLLHSDDVFEVRMGNTLLFRTHTHTHTDAQALSYSFAEPGTYTVRATAFLAYPDAESVLFLPGVAEKTVMVLASADGNGINPAPAAPTPPAAEAPALNAVAQGTAAGGNFTLVGTYDPYTVVGPNTAIHLSALVMDPMTREPVPHVNFEATLRGPAGNTLFTSASLHEYDGIYELTTVQPVPGLYTLVVDASKGGWSGHVEMPYTVAPPVLAVPTVVFSVGPQLYDVTGLDVLAAGVGHQLEFKAHDAAGNPFSHSEVDVQVLDGHGIAVLQTKLHTHDDGVYLWNLTLPTAGDYTMVLSPFPLMPQPAGPFYGASLGDGLSFALHVGDGPGVPALHPELGAPEPTLVAHASPGAGVGLLLALVGLALVARRST